MSTTHPLPNVHDMLGIFSMLYNTDLVREAESLTLDSDKVLLAVYVCDDDEPVCGCLFDRPFAAYSGCGLTRIPKGGAQDAIETGDFSAAMMGNVKEVMNIASRLMMNSSSPHIRLTHDIYQDMADVPEPILTAMRACTESKGFAVEIPNYGMGNMTFITT